MFRYLKSGDNIDIKEDLETGKVTVKTEKKFGRRGYVEYTREEVEILFETVGEIDPQIHQVKSIFGGEIVRGKE